MAALRLAWGGGEDIFFPIFSFNSANFPLTVLPYVRKVKNLGKYTKTVQ